MAGVPKTNDPFSRRWQRATDGLVASLLWRRRARARLKPVVSTPDPHEATSRPGAGQ